MLRASQINGCGWCVDFHTKEAAAAGETAVRLNLVAAWRESTVFTEAERAALALAEEGTRHVRRGQALCQGSRESPGGKGHAPADEDPEGLLLRSHASPGRLAQLVRALARHARGRRFESSTAHGECASEGFGPRCFASGGGLDRQRDAWPHRLGRPAASVMMA